MSLLLARVRLILWSAFSLDWFALDSSCILFRLNEGNSMPRHPEPAMTVRDVAAYLNVDEKTIYRLVQRGELPGFKVAGAWRFQLADIQHWIDERKHLPAGKETTKKGADGEGDK